MNIQLNQQNITSNILDYKDLNAGDVFIILSPNHVTDKIPFPFSNIEKYKFYICVFIKSSIAHDKGVVYSYLRFNLTNGEVRFIEEIEANFYKVIKLDATLDIKGFL